MQDFFGGVVLFTKIGFEQVNGYANSYWGWGFLDTDIALRCMADGVPLSRRKGTYQLLPHVNSGFEATGKSSEAHARNRALFEERFPPTVRQLEAYRQTRMKDQDGLSKINFSIVGRRTLPKPDTDERGLTI